MTLPRTPSRRAPRHRRLLRHRPRLRRGARLAARSARRGGGRDPARATDATEAYLSSHRLVCTATHTPGSDAKENFTIIGGGVSESSDQHVHIRETPGFNIGAAGQPPKCRNSLHSHRTAEA